MPRADVATTAFTSLRRKRSSVADHGLGVELSRVDRYGVLTVAVCQQPGESLGISDGQAVDDPRTIQLVEVVDDPGVA
ncbi:MAG: hypothetical protein WKF73_03355 [Nocardioidaceae bacterium]